VACVLVAQNNCKWFAFQLFRQLSDAHSNVYSLVLSAENLIEV